MASKYGVKMRERFPEHSPIHESGNPMRELLEEGIGAEFDAIETFLLNNSDGRFLINATGKILDLYGEWFGVSRGERTDDEYRALLLTIKAANPTVDGIKKVIANILKIRYDDVIVISGVGVSCKVGTFAADRYSGTPCVLAGHMSIAPGIVTIKIPKDSGIELIESVIDNLVLASVTVYLEEQYTAKQEQS